ncbi:MULTISPECIES: hypothetical protein [unclassified Streptomyces]|uniref:hypothetical protein n=1 Tax=unclassified Streptomyces TaxID=2593676 RepID=UPI00365FA393
MSSTDKTGKAQPQDAVSTDDQILAAKDNHATGGKVKPLDNHATGGTARPADNHATGGKP